MERPASCTSLTAESPVACTNFFGYFAATLIDIEIDSQESFRQFRAHLEQHSGYAVMVGGLYIEGPADCHWRADAQDVDYLVAMLARMANLQRLCVRIPGFNDPRVRAVFPNHLQAENIEIV